MARGDEVAYLPSPDKLPKEIKERIMSEVMKIPGWRERQDLAHLTINKAWQSLTRPKLFESVVINNKAEEPQDMLRQLNRWANVSSVWPGIAPLIRSLHFRDLVDWRFAGRMPNLEQLSLEVSIIKDSEVMRALPLGKPIDALAHVDAPQLRKLICTTGGSGWDRKSPWPEGRPHYVESILKSQCARQLTSISIELFAGSPLSNFHFFGLLRALTACTHLQDLAILDLRLQRQHTLHTLRDEIAEWRRFDNLETFKVGSSTYEDIQNLDSMLDLVLERCGPALRSLSLHNVCSNPPGHGHDLGAHLTSLRQVKILNCGSEEHLLSRLKASPVEELVWDLNFIYDEDAEYGHFVHPDVADIFEPGTFTQLKQVELAARDEGGSMVDTWSLGRSSNYVEWCDELESKLAVRNIALFRHQTSLRRPTDPLYQMVVHSSVPDFETIVQKRITAVQTQLDEMQQVA